MKTLTSHPTKIAHTVTVWQMASWSDYENCRDTENQERVKLYYYQNRLLVEMGLEGINHSSISDLFTMLFFIWFSQKMKQKFTSLGRCLWEKSIQTSGVHPRIALNTNT